MSESLLAIHLAAQACQQLVTYLHKHNLLFHDLDVYFLHIHFLIKFWRKLGLLEQLLIHGIGHDDGPIRSVLMLNGAKCGEASCSPD